MKKDTPAARERRHREGRIAEGWKRISVWVPTEDDAEAIRKLATELRSKAESLEDLKEFKVKPETTARIANALALHGSRAYSVASGAMLDLMSELCEEDDLLAVSHAYTVLARAKPLHADLAADAVPAKISNFLIRHRNVDARAFLDWTANNKTWAQDLKEAVRDPVRFTEAVEAMASAIKAARRG